MKKYPIGLDYKYAAQAKMHRECKGDLKKFMRRCGEAVEKIEREGGFKFKRGVPAGWTPPKINWANLTKSRK
jgi:hypothetical protein